MDRTTQDVSIGVVGTGLMGVGIATQAALHGYRTIVLDELIYAGRIDDAAKQAALARIETHAQLDAVAQARFVIEAQASFVRDADRPARRRREGGLDTFVDIASHLMPQLAKDEDVIDLLRAQVDAGRVGVRSGAGFHDWDEARLARVKEGRKRVIGRG